jgi:peptide subunit release factor RF-3
MFIFINVKHNQVARLTAGDILGLKESSDERKGDEINQSHRLSVINFNFRLFKI